MRLVVDNDPELIRLRSQWLMPNGEMSVATAPDEFVEMHKRLAKISPHCKASKLHYYMAFNLDRWNAVELDVYRAADDINTKPNLIRKYLVQLEQSEAFDRVEGDVYHFDPWMVFNPLHAPVEWLRELAG